MLRNSYWIAIVLATACGGGADGGAQPPADAPASTARAATRDASGPSAATSAPGEPVDVVIALIRAFQAGDRAAVEARWAADGGTWRDDAGFRERAGYYQRAEFELEPEKISTREDHGATFVAVQAKQDGQAYIWTFLVREIDGTLRAGGVESRPAGLP